MPTPTPAARTTTAPRVRHLWSRTARITRTSGSPKGESWAGWEQLSTTLTSKRLVLGIQAHGWPARPGRRVGPRGQCRPHCCWSGPGIPSDFLWNSWEPRPGFPTLFVGSTSCLGPVTSIARATRRGACLHAVGPGRAAAGRRAGDGDRTRITSLEGWGSAIELHPRDPEV